MVRSDIFEVEMCNSRLEETGIIIQSTSGTKDINMGNVCTKKLAEAVSLDITKKGIVRKCRSLMRGALQVPEVQVNQKESAVKLSAP